MRNLEDNCDRLTEEQLAAALAGLVASCHTGEISDADAVQLNTLLDNSSIARQIYLRLTQDTQSLRVWAAAQAQQLTATAVLSPINDVSGMASSIPNLPTSAASDGNSATIVSMTAHSSPRNSPALKRWLFGKRPVSFGWKMGAAAACVAFLITVGIAYRQSHEVSKLQAKLDAQAKDGDSRENPAPGALPRLSSVAATLVNVTNCRWDPTRSTADVRGGTVRPGQSLNLLEGVAEINSSLPSGGFGRFQLEGPLAMILTSEGMPSLQFGKLAAQVMCEFDRFTLDTPLGRAVLSPEASIGLVVAANEVELHVFRGEAKYEPLWPMNFSNSADDLKVNAGRSMRITTDTAGNFSIQPGGADENRFVTHVSMTASRLEISDSYVAEIRKSQPIAYWRFENDADGLVRNEIADRFHCRIHGDGVRWHSYHRNRAVEFGSTPEVGCLITDDLLDDVVKESYSAEAWIKPSRYHHGTVFSFINWTGQASAIPRHGMVFEVCGPVVGPVGGVDSWARYPGRIRFLHRNPPGDFNGVSCYSDSSYVLRKWQHVASVKDGSEMRLYLDGQLAATGQDSTDLPDGMRVLIGQLSPHDPRRVITSRPFVGELDEVAIYDRALTEKELTRHIQRARPVSSEKEKTPTTY